MYNKNVSEKVQAVSRQIEAAADEEEIFRIITDFYKAYGVGMFGLNKAFRIQRYPGRCGVSAHQQYGAGGSGRPDRLRDPEEEAGG